MSARRYIAVVQDPRGYPPPGELDPAPPEGPDQPVIHSVVLAEEYDRLREVTDEMVERAVAEYNCRPVRLQDDAMRAALESALRDSESP
jgi:hypothetical protein